MDTTSQQMISNNLNFNFNLGSTGHTWNNSFSGGCQRMLGGASSMGAEALLGNLLSSLLGGASGNPMGGLIGSLLGGLIGGSLGQHRNGGFANHRHPQHTGASCYPPSGNGSFGGSHGGGYNCSPCSGSGQYGQPHWSRPQCSNVNFNFNFGHHCPPSQSCHQQGPGRRDGKLSQEKEGKPIEYTTSGGYKVRVNKHDIIVTDPSGKNTVKHHGDPHEEVNGKHVKDWEGKQRTVVLGDGTKITMNADGPKGVTLGTSIYDGRQNIQIQNTENKITHHSFNSLDTLMRELRQHDGETASFRTNRNGTGNYSNIYNEDSNFNISSLYKILAPLNGGQK
jgi:hypothetical protein